ncbi:uncharacterized protein LOC126809558 [Patella vulgata]|uniref:uncharacterized protein LOC126809558 n=1 Tax=Patella vulgata TaxID=6465 RepID=UPI00218072FD|nr:uncharacterized protein LOC126809558 [Patella vulgata]
MTFLPAILYVGILMVVGLFGNSLVCFIFATKMKPGTQNIMIMCLAASDLLVCSKAKEKNRTTAIAFLVTIVFVVSYLPYLSMTFYIIFDKEFDQHLHGSSLVAYNLN